MAVLTVTYSANTAIALDLSSLAPSASLLAGWQSAQVDNTATMYRDALVSVKAIIAGATTPVVGQMIQVYAWGADTSLATTGVDTLGATSSAKTLSHASVLQSLRPAAAPSVTVATANLSYFVQPFSIAQLFGGNLPKFWGLFVAHNHAGALAAAQSGLFAFTGITDTAT